MRGSSPYDPFCVGPFMNGDPLFSPADSHPRCIMRHRQQTGRGGTVRNIQRNAVAVPAVASHLL